MEKWKDSSLEDVPFVDYIASGQSATEVGAVKKAHDRFLGLFVAIVIGIYAGLICRALQESFVYAALFVCEALVCVCVGAVIKNVNMRRIVCAFAAFFVSSAAVTPIACFIHMKFSN